MIHACSPSYSMLRQEDWLGLQIQIRLGNIDLKTSTQKPQQTLGHFLHPLPPQSHSFLFPYSYHFTILEGSWTSSFLVIAEMGSRSLVG
jgi:hypothetical protein